MSTPRSLLRAALTASFTLLVACGSEVETSSTTTGAGTSTGSGTASGAGGTLPTTPVGPSGPESLQELATGIPSCARRASGKVACWAPVIGADLTPLGVITDLPGITDARAVTVAYYHACVLGASGAVTCWGSNEEGELPGLPEIVETPTELPFVEAVSVSSGDHATTLVRPNGKVAVAGLGMSLTDVTGVDDAVLVAGGSRGCALRQGGSVACWNGLGAAAEPLPFLDDVTALAVTDDLGCALRSDATVWCWKQGVLSTVKQVKGFAEVRKINANTGRVCAVHASGEVSCFQWNHVASEPEDVHGVWDASPDIGLPCVIHLDGELVCGTVHGK